MSSHPLLMPCSIPALRQKLADAASPLAPWWNHFLLLSRKDPVFFSPYTVLAALVTQDPIDRDNARRSFLRFVDHQAEALYSQDPQSHTHVTSAPLGRWAIFYDWIADEGILSPEEDNAVRAYLLDHAFVFPMQQLGGRYRSFDNQVMANAFAAASVGYVLGVKRGQSALARRMYRSGLSWLRDLLDRLPPGGYSPEGSTYHEYVVLPLTLLSGLLIQETTGQPAIAGDGTPGKPTIRDLLDISYRMIGPGQLLPAWDHYGFQRASVKFGLAYLAGLTRDPAPLAVARSVDAWYRNTLVAWDIDDRLWTLVYWPSEIDTGPGSLAVNAPFEPWMSKGVAGALQDPHTRTRLFQYWDECGGVPGSGRSQVDPNAITLEAYGSPILIDGNGSVPPELNPIPQDQALAYVGARTVETIQEYVYSAWNFRMPVEQALASALAGSVGNANSLILDNEAWYVPKGPRNGHGEALHHAGPLQVVRADAVSYYNDRYDVSRVARTSVLINGKYVVTSDRVVANSPHQVTWQAFSRTGTQMLAERFVVRTTEQVHCDIIPLQAGGLEEVKLETYPKFADGGSVRVRHSLPPDTDVRLDMALIPQRGVELAVDLSDEWFWTKVDGTEIAGVSLRSAYLSDTQEDPASGRQYWRDFIMTRTPNKRYFVWIDSASAKTRIRMNGTPVSALISQDKGHWPGSADVLPVVYDVTDLVRTGENQIAIESPFFHGESVCGPVHLLVERDILPVIVKRSAHARFSVSIGGEVDHLVVENDAGEVGLGITGVTDARYAVLTYQGTVAAAQVMHLAVLDLIDIDAEAPVDISWSPKETSLTWFVEGRSVEVRWNGAQVTIRPGGCVEITHQIAIPHTLKLKLPTPRIVIVNGHSLGVCGLWTTIHLKPSANSAADHGVPTSAEDVYVLAAHPSTDVAELLAAAIQSPDWRVQNAAADVVGELGIKEAVPTLLKLFEEGETELPYPKLEYWWSVSKMLRDPNGKVSPSPDPVSTLTMKRWRVKRAVVTALGQIGDPRAVGPLERAMFRCDDFFPVTSQLAVALGRLGSETSIPILERSLNHAEVNTKIHARLSYALLKGEIDRAKFEESVGLG